MRSILQYGPSALGLGWLTRQVLDPYSWRRWGARAFQLQRLGNFIRGRWWSPPYYDLAGWRHQGQWRYYTDPITGNHYNPILRGLREAGPPALVAAGGALAAGASAYTSYQHSAKFGEQHKFRKQKIPISNVVARPKSTWDDYKYEMVKPYEGKGFWDMTKADWIDYAQEKLGSPLINYPMERIKKYLPSVGPLEQGPNDSLVPLMPLKRQHHGAGMMLEEEEKAFPQKLPESMDVTLTTKFTVPPQYLIDRGAYRNYTFNFAWNTVLDIFSSLPGAGLTDSQDASFWFSLYRYVHVNGVDITMHISPWSTGDKYHSVCAYIGNGYDTSGAELALDSQVSTTEWGSQAFGKLQTYVNFAAGPGVAMPWYWRWSINAERDFGSDIAKDNRIDQDYFGNMRAGPDAKFYYFHYGSFNATDIADATPGIDFVLSQHCTFYQNQSLIHA